MAGTGSSGFRLESKWAGEEREESTASSSFRYEDDEESGEWHEDGKAHDGFAPSDSPGSTSSRLMQDDRWSWGVFSFLDRLGLVGESEHDDDDDIEEDSELRLRFDVGALPASSEHFST